MDLKLLRQEIELISQNPSFGKLLGGLLKLAKAVEELHPPESCKVSTVKVSAPKPRKKKKK